MASIKEITDRITSGVSTASQEVEEAFERAASIDERHAFLSLTRERAHERAANIDARLAAGETIGRLVGVPFVVKDNFLAYGAPTTAASTMLENFDAPLQATVVERLEAEGAICIGKANLDAFAHGGSTENSAFGVTHNAHDMSKVAGGSSGGSAVVTALDVVPFALGTDTGGSIRQPASFNGVYGMKPTYGAVSRYGVVAMASSTDTIGCFTATADDLALVMDVMAGQDVRDMTTLPSFFAPTSLEKTLRIGMVREAMSDTVDPAVRQTVTNVVDWMQSKGHLVEDVSLPILKYTVPMYYIIVPAEISSNLARYDGVRYGKRADGAHTLADLYGRSRDEGFVMENKRRIMIGSYVLSSGFFDAYYQQAQKARTVLISEFNELFKNYDALIMPSAPTPAYAIGEKTSDPLTMYMADIMTVPASLAGLPALSVPSGASEQGLPIGVQLIGPAKSDATLIALAKTMEEK